ncbi:hypothetical protein H721_03223 [Brucella ovis IntaBari-2006-46-332]|nr:hypothetical protein C010_02208 [Brucella ovis 80/125]ENR05259.1 hypothetical protein C961_03085 [Brucella ovis F8/05B]ENS93866.1 hypothetical protein B999_02187 [Brucella ovis 63/96]ENS95462.1 hypothetical protein C009_03241 [Brucella ovis 81/8]ENT76265.1 hypothetical protein H720_03157 [Brucella ovis IntaBari-2006-46-348]ENT76483.1 hypothetical protein H712_02187 [Brucella ovis IntaBari-2009-88-4]ENT82249.1 hypothetical protein H713_02192 [Brucella ovis IntaBari-2010-47-268]ENT84612.1 h
MLCHFLTSGNRSLVEQICGWLATQGNHIFHEAAQFSQFLPNLWLRNEGSFAASDLDQATHDQIFNGLANGGPADTEPLDQAIFRREPGTTRKDAFGNLGCQSSLDLGIEGRMIRFNIHYDIMMSLRHDVNGWVCPDISKQCF